ncbi:MAG: bifunctional diguanylate cyclase/phosphodiesterase [Acidimicrobiia bacterium]|nr:bifunctional diguanylate cyclase/phosphodiesterase [Acidimicrobiia bacterium]
MPTRADLYRKVLSELSEMARKPMGSGYLESLCRLLSTALELDWVCVILFPPHCRGWGTAAGIWQGGKPTPLFSYLLGNSVASELISSQVTHFAAEVEKDFPEDELLRITGATCCMGTALTGAGGEAVGALLVCHGGAVPDAAWVECILRVAQPRAALEAEWEVMGSSHGLLLEELDHALILVQQQKDYHFAVLHLELDRYQMVRESLGQSAGEQLVSMATLRLQRNLRPRDRLFRVSGGEFVVLGDGIGDGSQLLDIAGQMQESFREPLALIPAVVTLVTIGIAVSQTGYGTAGAMLRDAAVALQRARNNQRGSCQIFDERIHARLREQLSTEAALRGALDRGEFALYYQPIYSLHTHRMQGLEALVRWNHPTRGLLLPEEFLEEAEGGGLIIPLGRWTLLQAAQQMMIWRARQIVGADMYVSVNLSGKQFCDPDLVPELRALLRETGLEAKCLRLEMTETVIMGSTEPVARTLRDLETAGIAVMLDDFGTGYSSLSRLSDFPIKALKIDGRFVSRMCEVERATRIVKAIVDLGRDLGMQVVAEGVESAKQLEMLQSLGCECAQGNYMSEPRHARDTLKLFRSAGA